VRPPAPCAIELVTERLHLRPVRAEDAGVAAAIGADERVMEWFGGAFSREKSDEWLARVVAHWEDHGFGRFAVVTHGTVVGFVGLSRTDFDAGIVPGVEVAWRLAFDQWGRGYATEAARAVLRDGFERLGLAVIVACTARSNARSRRVMERLGMAHSPAETFEHPLVAPGDPLRVHVLYRLSRPG
jgi:RimJ/RimL family protein N-acetyltransferase